MQIEDEIKRRRTFAIISHPDAGKTTLTEKFLLYGGAVHLAGSVKTRKQQRNTASDWMELERQRGISVSSTVLQFEYLDYRVNLLDTPGHRDFSEDTYRVLMAVDAVIMVIDAGKGIETQTRKLFEICRQRHIPIFTFMNKCDRPTRDPLELIDELENVLNLHAFPMNWPLGSGADFKGVYDRQEKQVFLFERVKAGAYRAPVSVHGFEDDFVKEQLPENIYKQAAEEIEMLDMAHDGFDLESVLKGESTPVYFGSAMNNFGVQMMLDSFLNLSRPPQAREAEKGIVPIDDKSFSGFIFKIQSNMDPKHRDRVAYMRICSGKFTRDMMVYHAASKKKIRLSNSHSLFGRSRETVNEAFAGDIVGLVGNDAFQIGDTLTEDASIVYHAIPRFAPECFVFIRNPNPAKHKPYDKGIDQLLREGIVQSLERTVFSNDKLLAAVGPLQFEVVQYRLKSEYGAESQLETAPWQVSRWLENDVDVERVKEVLPFGSELVKDSMDRLMVLFPSDWAASYFGQQNPEIKLLEHPE